MAIAKLLLLPVTVIALQYALTSPNVRPPTKELREQVSSERRAPLLLALFRAEIWTWASIEGLVTFALSGHCPPTLARSILHFLLPASLVATSDPTITPGPALTALTTLTPTFLTGVIFSLAGSLIRAHCYRTLGQRFTFELSIRPAHALVTDGAYGVVRHPSYTGGVMFIGGWLLCVLDPRGWFVRMCAGASGSEDATVIAVLTAIWVILMGWTFGSLHQRMNNEDAMLEKNFGEEWRAWAKRVPCRLVPGVY